VPASHFWHSIFERAWKTCFSIKECPLHTNHAIPAPRHNLEWACTPTSDQ
jgi:hypothetical protein